MNQKLRRMNKLGLSQHAIREKAVQSLFALAFNPDLTVQDAVDFAMNYNHQNEAEAPEALVALVQAVMDRQQELDKMIEPRLKNWTLQRLAKIDLIIMRIALVEMLGDSVPSVVAVHEAIQLADTFTNAKSRRFINAVLANILDELA